jgi:hypothetical protein
MPRTCGRRSVCPLHHPAIALAGTTIEAPVWRAVPTTFIICARNRSRATSAPVSNVNPAIARATPGVSRATAATSRATPGVSRATTGVGRATPGVSRATAATGSATPGVSRATPGVGSVTALTSLATAGAGGPSAIVAIVTAQPASEAPCPLATVAAAAASTPKPSSPMETITSAREAVVLGLLATAVGLFTTAARLFATGPAVIATTTARAAPGRVPSRRAPLKSLFRLSRCNSPRARDSSDDDRFRASTRAGRRQRCQRFQGYPETRGTCQKRRQRLPHPGPRLSLASQGSTSSLCRPSAQWDPCRESR